MTLYRNYVYPRLVELLGDPPPIRRLRHQMIPLAEGRVLEVGLGAGANLVHYDAAKVTKLYALEPNQGMIRLAQKQQRRTRLKIEFIDLRGERIPLRDGTVDSVVSTFTLCTIADTAAALGEIARVLKPDGSLIFLELCLSPDFAVRRWQVLWEPVQQWLFDGLTLTRDIPSLIAQSGFRMRQVERAYLARFPKTLSYCAWGTAVPVEKGSGT